MVEADVIAKEGSDDDNKSWFRRIAYKKLFLLGASGVFWIWQVALVVLSLFFILPYILPSLWISYQHHSMPAHYFALILLLMMLPLVCVGVIIWLLTNKSKPCMPLALKFFYGFELPAVLLIALFLINLRDYSLGTYWFLAIAILALCVWLVFICYERIHGLDHNRVIFANSPIAMAGSTVVFAVGLFVSVALSLFVVPVLVGLVTELIKFVSEFSLAQFWEDFLSINWLELIFGIFHWEGILIITFFCLFITSFVLFLSLPLVLLYLYMQQFLARIRQARSFVHALVVIVVLGILVGVHYKVNQQPQQAVFAMLQDEPVTDLDQHELIGQMEVVREGLLNAYLSRYRYISSTGSANSLTTLYRDVFNLDKEIAYYPQRIFNAMFSPIIYDGKNYQDAQDAALIYEQVFDIPIQQAEQNAIWDTLRFNHESSAQNAAGILDVNQEAVYLEKQTIGVTADEQLGRIRVTQKLVNQKTRQREAVMHFSLPEYAVITGVWLSNDENNLEQNAGLVAPRGAAQEVYNAQVSRRIDPALLEQVGPELYRLRVYPILGARTVNRIELKPGEPMFVTFEYEALLSKDGSLPIPELLEKRNLYWDDSTVTEVNGNTVIAGWDNDWIPREAGKLGGTVQSLTQIPANEERSIWAVPRSFVKTEDEPVVVSLENYAVLVDGSRSMHTLEQEVVASTAEFADAKTYFCKPECISTTPTDVSNQVYWGASQPIEQLNQFLESQDHAGLEGIVILTDSGGYELADDAQKVISSNVPVWVLHIGGSRPKAYADAWLTTVNQSGGDFIVGNARELKQSLWMLQVGQDIKLDGPGIDKVKDLKLTSVGADWLWFDGPVQGATTELTALNKLGVAREIIRVTKSGQTLGLQEMDELHSQALKSRIVTQLSSMIVLVNDAQKKALEEASKKDDRFDRENENGEQAVGVPADNLSVSAVPEPHEWAMLLVVLLFATVSFYRRRHAPLIPYP